MYYVYLIKSLSDPSKTYIGYTNDLHQRLAKHNAGGSIYTRNYISWTLIMYLAFEKQEKAIAFEKYLKAGSGHAFAHKYFW